MPAISVPVTPAAIDIDIHRLSSVDQVSGFYGPGAWASWIIAILWSWLVIKNGELTLTYDAMAHLIYTGWAAIDLFRQLKGDSTDTGALTAAMIATYWGLVNGLTQYTQIVGMIPEGVHRSSTVLLAIGFTTTLSAIALLACTIHLLIREEVLEQFQTGKDDDAKLMEDFTDAMINAAIIGFVAFVGPITWAILDGWFMSLSSAAVYTCLFLSIAVPYALVVGYMSVIFAILPLDLLSPDCTVWKPCTGLSLLDWDQAFALLCALIFIAREIGVTLAGSQRQRS